MPLDFDRIIIKKVLLEEVINQDISIASQVLKMHLWFCMLSSGNLNLRLLIYLQDIFLSHTIQVLCHNQLWSLSFTLAEDIKLRWDDFCPGILPRKKSLLEDWWLGLPLGSTFHWRILKQSQKFPSLPSQKLGTAFLLFCSVLCSLYHIRRDRVYPSLSSVLAVSQGIASEHRLQITLLLALYIGRRKVQRGRGGVFLFSCNRWKSLV